MSTKSKRDSERKAPRFLKMADYFKQDKPQEGPKFDVANQLEEDVLDNVDINYLFAQGENLKLSLFDPERAFKIVEKIVDISEKSEGADKEALVKFL